ncbi:MAG: protein kinase [Gemmatimonadota bacterium]
MDLHRTPLTGTIAERYEIRREAGRGGMAVVYLAWDLRHGRPVALKVLRPEIGSDLGAERFLREIQITSRLSHPHVLAVLDSGLHPLPGGGALPFYVMPFIEGPTLGDRLTDGTKLPIDEALQIAAEVAEALQYAHAHGVIHRDIKPGNILLHEGHALVADFGVARFLDAGSTVVTTVGMAIGTMHYMSPEQFTADPQIDGRSDVYALGCVLFEMLAGEPPFSGSTPAAVCARHQVERPRDLRRLRTGVSAAIQRVVAKALAKRPDDRYASAEVLHADLIQLQGAGGGTSGWSVRRRWVAVVGGLLATAAILTWHFRPATSAVGNPVTRVATRIAVLPFRVEGNDSVRAASDRISESLTDRLQAVPDLAVTASAMLAPFRDMPMDSLRARFPLDRLVTGSVVRHGDSLAMIVRLVDPATGLQLDSKAWTVAMAAPAASIADRLSSFVRESLWRERLTRMRRAQVNDDSAWNLIEAARSLRQQADLAVRVRADRQGFQKLDQADSLLSLAEQRDRASLLIPLERAQTAQFRAYLAEYIPQRLEGSGEQLPDPSVARASALSLVDLVLRDHPRQPEALAMRGGIRLGLYRDKGADSELTGAINDFEQATANDPEAVRSWRELSRAYLMAGRYPESMMAIEQAAKVDPYQVNQQELLRGRFEIALLVGDFDKAGRACQTGLQIFRDDQRFSDCEVEWWGRTRSDPASITRALAITDSLARAGDDSLFTAHRNFWIGAMLARAGHGDSADRIAARVLGALKGTAVPTTLLVEAASLRLLRGEPDSALVLIAQAVRQNRREVPYLSNAPWFTSLRRDPHFAAALAGISPREAGPRP